jgi:hypothetical protein
LRSAIPTPTTIRWSEENPGYPPLEKKIKREGKERKLNEEAKIKHQALPTSLFGRDPLPCILQDVVPSSLVIFLNPLFLPSKIGVYLDV